jgi:transposase InsO family protein
MDIKLMCELFGITRSSFYARLKHPVGKLDEKNAQLLPKVQQSFIEGRRTYGTRRIQRDLRRIGHCISRRRIRRLMDCGAMQPQTAKAFRHPTTQSDSRQKKPVDQLQRCFVTDAPNKVWTGDITVIFTLEGLLYLAVVEDLFSRMIVGWSMAERQTASLVKAAFDNACVRRNPPPGCIFHSDQGSQYGSSEFQNELEKHNFIPSMGSIGDCFDNAVTESVIGTIKSELLLSYRKVFQTRDQARSMIFDYIECFYNRSRLHSSLGYLSPEQYERQCCGG